MEDRFIKYSKLYLLIFLLFLAVPVVLGSLAGLMYGFSKLVSSSIVDMIFELVVVVLPVAVFSTVYYIFFKRTKYHPAVAVKIISQLLFILGFLYCCITLVMGIRQYFTIKIHDITGYSTYSLLFLAGNIGMLFFLAIIQAFTTDKEEDWMEKRRKKDNDV
ncbi:MAG: hypothetical protein WCI49_06730 [Ferruginibacter sp.]